MDKNVAQETHRTKPASERMDYARDGPDDAEKDALRVLVADVMRLAVRAVETGQLSGGP